MTCMYITTFKGGNKCYPIFSYSTNHLLVTNVACTDRSAMFESWLAFEIVGGACDSDENHMLTMFVVVWQFHLLSKHSFSNSYYRLDHSYIAHLPKPCQLAHHEVQLKSNVRQSSFYEPAISKARLQTRGIWLRKPAHSNAGGSLCRLASSEFIPKGHMTSRTQTPIRQMLSTNMLCVRVTSDPWGPEECAPSCACICYAFVFVLLQTIMSGGTVRRVSAWPGFLGLPRAIPRIARVQAMALVGSARASD